MNGAGSDDRHGDLLQARVPLMIAFRFTAPAHDMRACWIPEWRHQEQFFGSSVQTYSLRNDDERSQPRRALSA